MGGMRKVIGDSSSTFIWKDNQVPCDCNTKLQPLHMVMGPIPTLVSSLIDPIQRKLRLNPIVAFMSPKMLKLISTISLLEGDVSDSVIWPWTSNRDFTVRSGHHWLVHSSPLPSSTSLSSSHIIDLEYFSSVKNGKLSVESLISCDCHKEISLPSPLTIHSLLPFLLSV